MLKSASVVTRTGSARVSLILTRQASARLIGTLAYFCMRARTRSSSSPRSKATTTAPRRRIAARLGRPRDPTRWNASDRAASQVFQGGARRGDWAAAHGWWRSRRLSRAIRKPASTSTLPAIARALQICLLLPTQIGWEPIHGADEIGDDGRRHAPRASSTGEGQALPNDIGFRALPL